ncbi:MAG: hypothetical protein CMG66_05655 [Candidatus Marinimicrobia bacterium]|nr:hypothetical protein [Candidatus Neomarinimicrobiota bacterium]|tara:strand:+ start:2773 stop:3303 length:531 start_codon:yes stop_codon:yes gene_type:complete
MKNFIIHVFGIDRIGMTFDITKEIKLLNGNIETSKMIKLGEDFNMLILISLNPKKISILKEALKEYTDLSFTIKETSKDNFNNGNKFIFRLKGADNEGIVHYCTKLFSKLNINILDLETKIMNAPNTGSPLFYIKAVLLIPDDSNIKNQLEDNIIKIENDKNVVIKFSNYDSTLNH